jgi:membrane protease YdiL (CAAX protease family)
MNEPSAAVRPAILLKNFRAFVESVLPVDPGQTALLFGAVLMLSIPHMHSWHMWLQRLARVQGAGTAAYVSVLLTLPLYLIYFAGAVALWVGLVEVARPQLWIRAGVFAPFWMGLALNLILGWRFQNHYSTVPLVTGATFLQLRPAVELAARLPGHTFSVALLAWLMILIADKRLSASRTTLPVRFPAIPGDDPGAAKPTATLIWAALVITSLLGLVVNPFAAILTAKISSTAAVHTPSWLENALWEVAWGIGFATIIWFAAGNEKFATFSRSLRIPHAKWVALAILFPLAVGSAVPVSEFFVYRIRGPAHYPSNYPSELSGHFPTFEWGYLFFIVSALAEEIAWRGYLQPKFIRRFGPYRGIFLVGIVWGALHFPWSFSGRTNLAMLSIAVVQRLMNCVLWGFVLSWLTLKARSVISAAITHGLMNALYQMNWEAETSLWIIFGLWGALAFLLFRFWPPEIEDESMAVSPPNDELHGGGGVIESTA